MNIDRSIKDMRIRYGLDSTNLVDESADDRDLVAMINEARDPADVDRIAAMARHRQRSRRDAAKAGTSERRRPAFGLARVLSFRH
jgi:hypothetical protein